MASMVTATTWVRRGVAAQFPEKYELDEEELNRISELARVQLEDAKTDLKAAQEEGEDEEMAMGEEEAESSSKPAKGKGKETARRLDCNCFTR